MTPRPKAEKPFVNTKPKAKALFPFDEHQVDNELLNEIFIDNDAGGRTQVEGSTPKEQLENIRASYKNPSKVSLKDYCTIVYEWLLLNRNAFSVLEYYEEEANRPFAYPLEDVERDERIRHLLEQRIINLCLTQKLKYGFGITLLCTKYGWVTSRSSTVEKEETKPDNGADDTPVQFKFGN